MAACGCHCLSPPGSVAHAISRSIPGWAIQWQPLGSIVFPAGTAPCLQWYRGEWRAEGACLMAKNAAPQMQTSSLDSTPSRRESTVLRGPRMIRDSETGDVMTVVERGAEGVAGARAPRCLVFSTDRGFTRVWNYPENWVDLTDAELKAISEFRRAHTA